MPWFYHKYCGHDTNLKKPACRGKTGALCGEWSHLGFHWMGNYHNIASMLTETAQAQPATPIYMHPHQLGGDGGTLRGMPHYKPQTNFPNPWPGS